MALLSGNLPDELVVEILCRIPSTKTLKRFSCVSKSWSELIDGSSNYFMLKHLKQNQSSSLNNHHIFVSNGSLISLDDPSSGVLRPPIEAFRGLSVQAIGDGVIYFKAWFSGALTKDFVWNPATGKVKAVPEFKFHLDPFQLPYREYFGVCFDYYSNCVKVVRLMIDDQSECKKLAEIWSLDSESWREIDVNVHEDLGYPLTRDGQLYIGGACYWAGVSSISETESMDGSVQQQRYCRFLVSFDMVNERLNRSSLPGGLGTNRSRIVMAELKQSLAVISVVQENYAVEVWLMNKDDDKHSHSCSWSKKYSFKVTPFDDVSGRRRLYPLGLCNDTESVILHEYSFRRDDESLMYYHNMKTNETISSSMPSRMLNSSRQLYLYKESLVPV